MRKSQSMRSKMVPLRYGLPANSAYRFSRSSVTAPEELLPRACRESYAWVAVEDLKQPLNAARIEHIVGAKKLDIGSARKPDAPIEVLVHFNMRRGDHATHAGVVLCELHCDVGRVVCGL